MSVTIKTNTRRRLLFISGLFFISVNFFFAQKTLSGIVTDTSEYPIEDVQVSIDGQTAATDKYGRFSITYSDDNAKVSFTATGFLPFEEYIPNLNTKHLEIVLYDDYESGVLRPVYFRSKKEDDDLSSIQISGEKSEVLPSISGGVQDLLKTLPSVNSNSELSSQYMVRGGNYDENLTYINNIEIYRPQLIRNAQQEGYSIVNPSMVQYLNFSPGGYESSYGDRMSSVLDIYYKVPKKNYVEMELSLINAEITAGLTDKKNKFSALLGGRFRDTNLILNTLDGDTDFNPRYYDFQGFMSYKFNSKFKIQFLGTFADNDFEMEPKTRETTFGTLFQPIKLLVKYNGFENDKYVTENASMQFIYQPRKKWTIQFSPFYYHSTEEEYFDIAGGYALQELDSSGNPVAGYDAGGQINHARNDLDVLVAGVQFRTDYDWTTNRTLSFGFKYQQEDIRDFQTEWQLLDSVGYSIPRNPYEIGSLDDTELQLDYYINSKLNQKSNRFNGFVQYVDKFYWGSNKVLINAGMRGTYWDFNQEFNFSPRFQFTIRPDWNRDMNFKLLTGLYYQPPFYKEMRRLDGTLNEDIKAQQSFHLVFGNDYFLDIWKRPFKLTTELYYKHIKNLIPYYIDNVRVKYTGENDATGKVYGIESRLNGEFVPGVESWFSISYARAKQNINDRGEISLPTDPRFKASLFFQDEMKVWPSMKAAINLIYASGLPNGAPYFSDPYDYQSNLPSYKRVDLSLTKVFADDGKFKKSSGFLSKFDNFSLSLDIFNIFNISNTISNQWVRDINSGVSYAVPNRLTGRFFNLRLNMKF